MSRALTLLAVALFAIGLARDTWDGWVNDTVLPPLSVAVGQEVLDRDGNLLRAFLVEDGRWRLAHGPVDPAMTRALVAYEDTRFFRHSGVDALALLRAAAQSVAAGRVVSGGSTLTMQVARLLENSGTGRWSGKLRQMRVAWALELRLTKAQILDLYYHLAPYGGNIEGIRAASLTWFGKPPRRLTPAEIALLVALPQAPETRRPDRDLANAQAARDRTLKRLLQEGVFSKEDITAAYLDHLPATRRAFPRHAPLLAERLVAEYPMTRQIRTTLDAALQERVEALVKQSLHAFDSSVSAAVIVADHTTGEVLVRLGSGAYSQQQGAGFVDMTRAVRSPGSTLKPLIYGLAFDLGIAHPETILPDNPVSFDGYAPQNFDDHFRGEVRAAEALRLSLNIPVVHLSEKIGPARVFAATKSVGMNPQLQGAPGLALSLGGVGVTLEGLVSLYAGIAQGGQGVPLKTASGEVPDPEQRFLGPAAAWQVGNILRGLAPPPGFAGDAVAYKTGTSYGHRDTWAIGFDGKHVVGVWMGRPDGTPMPGALGAEVAAPLMFGVFDRLGGTRVAPPPPPPETLLVTHAQLPPHLKRFGLWQDAPSLSIAFPPSGAVVAGPDLVAKVRSGTGPYTWLANGRPMGQSVSPQIILSDVGAGFVTLAVIDAKGASGQVAFRMLP